MLVMRVRIHFDVFYSSEDDAAATKTGERCDDGALFLIIISLEGGFLYLDSARGDLATTLYTKNMTKGGNMVFPFS